MMLLKVYVIYILQASVSHKRMKLNKTKLHHILKHCFVTQGEQDREREKTAVERMNEREKKAAAAYAAAEKEKERIKAEGGGDALRDRAG